MKNDKSIFDFAEIVDILYIVTVVYIVDIANIVDVANIMNITDIANSVEKCAKQILWHCGIANAAHAPTHPARPSRPCARGSDPPPNDPTAAPENLFLRL